MSQYTLKVECYCEDKFIIDKPYWVRTSGPLCPDQMLSWASRKLAEGKITEEEESFYRDIYTGAQAFMAKENADWVKVGYIEDRRKKHRYPGQAVIVAKEDGGPMYVILRAHGEFFPADRMQFDQFTKPGTGRRLFYGFYDPTGLYYRQKAIDEQVAAHTKPKDDDADMDMFKGWMAR